jgi:hypothetical protein
LLYGLCERSDTTAALARSFVPGSVAPGLVALSGC